MCLQTAQTTLADASQAMDVAKDVVTQYVNNNGSMMRQYLKSAGSVLYISQVMSGSLLKEEEFPSKQFSLSVSQAILKSFATRFSELDDGIIAATRIANFKNWPMTEQKQMLLNLAMKLWKHFVFTLRIL